MFDHIRDFTKSWFARFLLFAIIISFAAGGLYLGQHQPQGVVAKINGESVSEIELLRAARGEEMRLRSLLGDSFDPRMIDQNALRQQALSRLIEQTLMLQYAKQEKLVVSPEQIKSSITAMPPFQENGIFSYERYEAVLKSVDYTPAEFESEMGQEAVIQQLVSPYIAMTLPAWLAVDYQKLAQEKRTVRLAMLSIDENAVSITEDESRNFYEVNPRAFLRPERARLRFVVLDAGAQSQSFSKEAQQSYYERHKEQFSLPEKRKVRHILVKDEKKAQAIYNRLIANLSGFTKEASENSEDEGSRVQGGELGWIGKGETVPEFESTIFSLSQGQISKPFRSAFGWHIAQVEAIEPAKVQPFESVQKVVQKKMGEEKQQKLFEEKKQKMHDLFDQGASLEEIASALQLRVEETNWIERTSNVEPWNNPEVQEAIFGQGQKGIVPPVDLSADQVLLAEIAAFEDEHVPSFAEVKEEVEAVLKKEKAKREAAIKGQKILAQEKQELSFGNAIPVGANSNLGLSADLLHAVMTASGPFPKTIGLESEDGFLFIEIISNEVPEIQEPAKEYAEMLTAMYRQELLVQMIGELQRKAKIQMMGKAGT